MQRKPARVADSVWRTRRSYVCRYVERTFPQRHWKVDAKTPRSHWTRKTVRRLGVLDDLLVGDHPEPKPSNEQAGAFGAEFGRVG